MPIIPADDYVLFHVEAIRLLYMTLVLDYNTTILHCKYTYYFLFYEVRDLIGVLDCHALLRIRYLWLCFVWVYCGRGPKGS